MAHESGCIYILTNPSFPEYVKIGYASNLEKRLKQLNRSETIPYAFRAYAIYEVEKSLTDKELHKLIDKLNPDLRTIDNFDGKERIKEFFAMSAEDAYGLLECIAKISGTTDRLKKVKPEGHEIEDEKTAKEITETARRGPFKFGECGIPVGAELTFVDDASIKVRFSMIVISSMEMKLLQCLHSLDALKVSRIRFKELYGSSIMVRC